MSFFLARSIEEWRQHFDARESVVTVGNFDGLHVGHQQILRDVVERAKQRHSLAAIITFDPHPLQFLRPENAPLLITTTAQRLAAFEQLGLDAALVLQFDASLARLTPEEFARQVLHDAVHAREILVGANFRFGHKHAGDVAQLKALGAQLGFAVDVVPPVEIDGSAVSSTRVREAVQQGRMDEAAKLLGRAFSLTGEIVAGAGRGAKIVFPTLNLAPDQQLLPARGVYATESIVGERPFPSVTNVGVRPTFNGSNITVESHLLDFSDQVKSGRFEVRFLKHLRDERKFAGPEELREQIRRDIESARAYFENSRAMEPQIARNRTSS
jgi:riboflavin kinase / FMN adenylyltransferase